ncbi:hypothetical protein HDU67_003208, partial [Dinochytrium kinnereticum]
MEPPLAAFQFFDQPIGLTKVTGKSLPAKTAKANLNDVIDLDSDTDMSPIVSKPIDDKDSVICVHSDEEGDKIVDAPHEEVIDLTVMPTLFPYKYDAGLKWGDLEENTTDILVQQAKMAALPKGEDAIVIEDSPEPEAPPKKKSKKQKKKEREEERKRKLDELKQNEEARRLAEKYDGTRRVIFCTNVAETSLTFPRIGYVIDSGLRFTVTYMPIMNMQKTGIISTTKVSALQRKGRAGRLGPGKCYRLYSEEESKSFPEQTFSNPDQLDYMLLSILEMYDTLEDFEWFTKPEEDEIAWTLSVLEQADFITRTDDRIDVTSDGKIALDLGRFQVPAQAARFLIDVWRCKASSSALKEHCVVIAAFHAARATRSFKHSFKYEEAVEDCEIDEEIPCPPELKSLPATICKVNIYWMWRRKQSSRQRKKFCKKAKLRGGDFEEIHQLASDIMKCMKRKHDVLTPDTDWFFDPADWNQDDWDMFGSQDQDDYDFDSEEGQESDEEEEEEYDNFSEDDEDVICLDDVLMKEENG